MSIKYEAMNDLDIRFYLGKKARILTYNELAKFKTIEKLLPHHKAYFILLYPVASEFNGHWVCMTRYDKTLEYFSSYGTKPEIEFTWSTSNFKDNPRYLTQLLNNTKLHTVYNSIDFQSKRQMISTCGAFAVFRVLTLIELNADLGKNNLLLQTLKDSNPEFSFDDIVVNYINKR